MRRYEFKYKIIKVNGEIVENTIKAIHQRNAKKCLKLKFPLCGILECDPVMVPTNGLRLGKFAKGFEGMVYE